jgi:predicted RNA-binding Zn ribbon-like protein
VSENVNRENRAFQPISGHRTLDLLATLRDRHRNPSECLRIPADLDRWLAVADLKVDECATATDLDAARQLRESIYRLVRAVLDAQQPPTAELLVLNEWAARPGLAPQIGPDLEQQWSGGPEAALTVVAREAVGLLGAPDRKLIRECAAAPECSRIYLDRSPGRRRRWCHMPWCGSNAKMRAYRRRRTTAV